MAKKAPDKIIRNGMGTGPLGGGLDPYEQLIEKGEARAIALADIEKGITALWQSAGKRADGEGEPPVMRTCVLNLIIFTDSDEELNYATTTIARLTWAFPSRSLVLLAKPDEKEEVFNAWISAHCQVPDKGRKVCCEQITIEGRGAAAERMGSMVLPLIVPDLPIVLWWMGTPKLDGPLFTRLIETADRLIIDSRNFEHPLDSFQRLAELARSQRNITRFSDLGWARLTPWRSSIAHMFDRPATMAFIHNIDRLEIDYETPNDTEIANFSEAFLLVGWFAKLLGWKPVFSVKLRGQNATLILDREGQPLNVELHGHNKRKDELGGVTAVTIHASLPTESREGVLTLALTDDFEHTTSTVIINGETISTETNILPLRDTADLLYEELGIVDHDILYEGSLAIASKFMAN